MKGQYLFVRPGTADDNQLVAQLSEVSGYPFRSSPEFLIGKLAGTAVALLCFEIPTDGGPIILHDLLVAPELRKKRIGAGMIAELARLGRTLGRTSIATTLPVCPFLTAAGFAPAAGVLQRSIEGE